MSVFCCSKTAFIFLGSNIQNNFIMVCVFAFISEFCSIEYLKLSFGHLFYLTYLCSLGKFPSCCQLLLNHMFKCIIRGELPVSSTLLFTFILYLILHHIYQA